VVNVEAVIVVLNVVTTEVFNETPVAVFAGAVKFTTGAGAVVKLQM
jgi:hypothetical protein